MGLYKIKVNDLKSLKFTNNQAKSLAINTIRKHYKHHEKEEQLQALNAVLANPEAFANDAVWGKLVAMLLPQEAFIQKVQLELIEQPQQFKVFGRKLIDSNAYQQMTVAMRLPIAVKGALMPDAHQGYGLPIGGVLATENAVIPYGVGVDIGCRMSLTLYDVNEEYFKQHRYQFEQALKNNTFFGNLTDTNIRQEHEVLYHKLFKEIPLLSKLHGKAVHQLGTSGSGNHFVEFGMVDIYTNNTKISAGRFLGILSHSGSRGLGASIANYYTEIAKQQCLLPREAANRAWLNLDESSGEEYWLAMNLAGEYAKACHDQIHFNLAKTLGLKEIAKVENHHNFAWKEFDAHGKELIVHRKGATPARQGEFGIIPGSMTAPGFIVEGLGNESGLHSASHGAGRKLSRGKAKSTFTSTALNKYLKQHHVHLIGGGPDEAPQAYKDIEEVMKHQTDLVKTIGKFQPMMVRMDKK